MALTSENITPNLSTIRCSSLREFKHQGDFNHIDQEKPVLGFLTATKKSLVVMFTDIVGYARLMDHDEQKALDLLALNREIQNDLIRVHGGTWIKEMGDGIIASFPSIAQAVACSLDINKKIENTSLFQPRTGIHSGRVSSIGNDLFGNVVNITALLQGQARPGQVLISSLVAQGTTTMNVQTNYMGTQNLKNINNPVNIWEVRPSATELPGNLSHHLGWEFPPLSMGRMGVWAAAFLLIMLCSLPMWSHSHTSVYSLYSTVQIGSQPLEIIPIIHLGGHLILSGKLNGKNAYFLLDTGASCSVLHDKAAKAYQYTLTQWRFKKPLKTAGFGHTNYKSRIAIDAHLTLGSQKISYGYLAKDLSAIVNTVEDSYNIRIVGIIGSDLLKRYRCLVDMGNFQLIFQPPQP